MMNIENNTHKVISTYIRRTNGGASRPFRSRTIAVCICVCGTQFEVALDDLKSGHTKSCGCLLRKARGLSGGLTHRIWKGIKHRCSNEKAQNYKHYGGRGIKICDEWEKSFLKFYDDMGPCPDGMTIERLDTNGNYEPENCVWATLMSQARNKRNTIHIEYKGSNVILADLARESGIDHATIKYRIFVMGLSPEQAMQIGRAKRKNKPD